MKYRDTPGREPGDPSAPSKPRLRSTRQHSYANASDLHTIDKPRLRSRRGRLHPRELMRLEEAVRMYVGL